MTHTFRPEPGLAVKGVTEAANKVACVLWEVRPPRENLISHGSDRRDRKSLFFRTPEVRFWASGHKTLRVREYNGSFQLWEYILPFCSKTQWAANMEGRLNVAASGTDAYVTMMLSP
jgi:hypothetical protein